MTGMYEKRFEPVETAAMQTELVVSVAAALEPNAVGSQSKITRLVLHGHNDQVAGIVRDRAVKQRLHEIV